MKEVKTKLIGVAGTGVAGKDIVADMLCRMYGAENLSTGDFIRAVTRFVYRLPPDYSPLRDQTYEVATYLRSGVNPETTILVCMLQARVLGVKYGVLTGLRTTGEADAIRARGGIIVGVDADTKVRYERIHVRQRDTETTKTFEEFLLQDELENKGIAQTGNLRGIRAIINEADIVIKNNGTISELEDQVREKLSTVFE